MQFRNTLIAFVLLLGLSLALYLTRPIPPADEFELLFPGLKPGEVQALSLIRNDIEIELSRDGNHWFVVTDGRRLADAMAVKEFLERVTSARVYRRLTGVDPSVKEFGLQGDQAGEYRLKTPEKDLVLQIGRTIPGRGGVYARVNGQVVITDSGLDALVRKPVERLVRRNIFDWLGEDIVRFSVSTATEETRLERDPEGNWWMTSASMKFRTSRRRVDDWLDTLLEMESGNRFPENAAETGGFKVRVRLETAAASQEIQLLEIGGILLVRDPESGVDTPVSGTSLYDLRFEKTDFRAVNLLDFNLYRLKKLTITPSDTGSVTLTRWKDGWRTVNAQGGSGVLPAGGPDEILLNLATLAVQQLLDPPLAAEIQSLRHEKGITLSLEIPPRQETETLFIPATGSRVVFHSQEPGAILLDDTDAVKLQQVIVDLQDLTGGK